MGVSLYLGYFWNMNAAMIHELFSDKKSEKVRKDYNQPIRQLGVMTFDK